MDYRFISEQWTRWKCMQIVCHFAIAHLSFCKMHAKSQIKHYQLSNFNVILQIDQVIATAKRMTPFFWTIFFFALHRIYFRRLTEMLFISLHRNEWWKSTTNSFIIRHFVLILAWPSVFQLYKTWIGYSIEFFDNNYKSIYRIWYGRKSYFYQ